MSAGSFPAFAAEYPGNCERWYPRVQQSLGATTWQVMGTGVFDGSAGAAACARGPDPHRRQEGRKKATNKGLWQERAKWLVLRFGLLAGIRVTQSAAN